MIETSVIQRVYVPKLLQQILCWSLSAHMLWCELFRWSDQRRTTETADDHNGIFQDKWTENYAFIFHLSVILHLQDKERPRSLTKERAGMGYSFMFSQSSSWNDLNGWFCALYVQWSIGRGLWFLWLFCKVHLLRFFSYSLSCSVSYT